MTNRIRIGELNNQCRFLGRQQDVAFLASEMRQLSEAELPEAIGEEVMHRLHSLLQRDGIYRIRRLRLHLALTRRDLSTRQLGGLMAERLVEALRVVLEQPHSADVAYFPSQTDFIGQMMADLLLQEKANLWMYEDYVALRHLSAVEAVVQLLLPRAGEAGALLAGLGKRQALNLLLRSLDDEQAGRLLRQWSGQNITAQFRADVVPDCNDLQQLAPRLEAASANTFSNTLSLTQETMRHLLLCLAHVGRQIPLETALWAVAHRVFVHRYRHLVSSVLLDSGSSTPDVLQSSTSAIGRPDANDEAITSQQDLRRWIDGSAEHRHYVMRLLREERPKEIAALLPARAGAREQGADLSRDKLLFSARAGLVLLIPVIISLRLHNCFTMAQLRDALWMAGENEEHEVPQEAWLRTLLPDVPQPLPDGTLPAAWRLGLSAQRQNDIERLMQSGSVVRMLATLLLAQFAARLSGLQGSSDAYLRSQFLHHSGYLVIDDTQIVVRLDSVPLFIVLRMAGLAGWSDQLPWLQRPLTIDITQ